MSAAASTDGRSDELEQLSTRETAISIKALEHERMGKA